MPKTLPIQESAGATWNDWHVGNGGDIDPGFHVDEGAYTDPNAAMASPTGFVLPNMPNVQGQDVTEFANELVGNPAAFFNSDMRLQNHTPLSNYAQSRLGSVNEKDGRFHVTPNRYDVNAATGQTATAANVDSRQAVGYNAQTTFDQVAANDAQAAQGAVSDNAQITPEQLDMQGMGTGVNTDGTRNYTGEALGKAAIQGMQVIDTSTTAGKMLAQSLGEGNYVDYKATVQGQLDILSKEFTDPVTGDPKIPSWAAPTARNVQRIAAFGGMTGSAATQALSTALMEASLPIAQQDAQFFQTLTVQNLNNRQQQTINTANVLAKMDMTNLDNRMLAAVENARSFMTMDLQNLNNRQQTNLVNSQQRVQSILEDARAVNAERLFLADATNNMGMFYDNLNTQINQFNAGQLNAMEQFNVSEINGISQFNASLSNAREQFYQNMQYNIDIANAQWRQTLVTADNQRKFEAATFDVRNSVGLSIEQLNRLWDRADSILDYAWKSSENALERDLKMALGAMQADSGGDGGGGGGIFGSILGSIGGSILGPIGSGIGKSIAGALF